jgi:hypothetical protein
MLVELTRSGGGKKRCYRIYLEQRIESRSCRDTLTMKETNGQDGLPKATRYVQVGNGWSSERLIYRFESKLSPSRSVEVDTS